LGDDWEMDSKVNLLNREHFHYNSKFPKDNLLRNGRRERRGSKESERSVETVDD